MYFRDIKLSIDILNLISYKPYDIDILKGICKLKRRIPSLLLLMLYWYCSKNCKCSYACIIIEKNPATIFFDFTRCFVSGFCVGRHHHHISRNNKNSSSANRNKKGGDMIKAHNYNYHE